MQRHDYYCFDDERSSVRVERLRGRVQEGGVEETSRGVSPPKDRIEHEGGVAQATRERTSFEDSPFAVFARFIRSLSEDDQDRKK